MSAIRFSVIYFRNITACYLLVIFNINITFWNVFVILFLIITICIPLRGFGFSGVSWFCYFTLFPDSFFLLISLPKVRESAL